MFPSLFEWPYGCIAVYVFCVPKAVQLVKFIKIFHNSHYILKLELQSNGLSNVNNSIMVV